MALNLFAKLGLDGKGFQQGMERVKTQAKGMSKSIGGYFKGMGGVIAGAFAFGAVTAKMKEAMDFGTRMRDLAKQFGVSSKFVQQLDYAFSQSGMNAEVAMGAFSKMMTFQHRALSEFRGGMRRTELQASFEMLGVTVDDLKNMKPEQLFMKIGEQMKTADYSSQHLQESLNTIFGGAGQQMLVAFGGDMEGMMKKAEELGLVMDDDVVNGLGAANDKMEELKSKSRAMFGELAVGMIPVAGAILGTFKKVFDGWKGIVDGMADYYVEILAHMKPISIGGDYATTEEQAESDRNTREQARKTAETLKKQEERRIATLARLTNMTVAEVKAATQNKVEEEGHAKRKKGRQELLVMQLEEEAAAAKEREANAKKVMSIEKSLADRQFAQLSTQEKLAKITEDLLAARETRAKAEAKAAAIPSDVGKLRAALDEAAAGFEAAKQTIGNLEEVGEVSAEVAQAMARSGNINQMAKLGSEGGDVKGAAAQHLKDSRAKLKADTLALEKKTGGQELTLYTDAARKVFAARDKAHRKSPEKQAEIMGEVEDELKFLDAARKKFGGEGRAWIQSMFDVMTMKQIEKKGAVKFYHTSLADKNLAAAEGMLAPLNEAYGADVVQTALKAQTDYQAAKAEFDTRVAEAKSGVTEAQAKVDAAAGAGVAERNLAAKELAEAKTALGQITSAGGEKLAVLEAQKAEADLADKQTKLQEAAQKEADAVKVAKPERAIDSLQRLGIVRGGKSPEFTLQEKQLSTLKEMAKRMIEANENTSNLRAD